MKIVIISRTTFPRQTPRAFRTAELSEELSRRGHDVTVYAVLGNYDYKEYTNRTGVKIKPIPMHFALENSDGIKKIIVVQKILLRLFNNSLEWPDIEFVAKMRGIIKKEDNIDLLITIAFPHTIHWGVGINSSLLKGKVKCWIGDCGDPYLGNPISKKKKYFSWFEHKWCKAVDYITVPTQDSVKGYFAEYHDKIRVIPQGFNFDSTPIAQYKPNIVPTFMYAGAIYNGFRDPYAFLDYLNSLSIDFKFIIFTPCPIRQLKAEQFNGKVEIIYGKSRKEIIYELSKADFLINIGNPDSVQTPSKLIDYGIANRPILNISTHFQEKDTFNQFIGGDYSRRVQIPNLNNYNIRTVADKFLELTFFKG